MSHRCRKLAVASLAVAAALSTTTGGPSAASGSHDAPADQAGQADPAYGDTLTPTTADAPGRPATYPSLREWQGRTGSWSLTRHTRILVSGPHARTTLGVARMLQQDLRTVSGRKPAVKVVPGPDRAAAHDIALSLGADDDRLGPDGYRLDSGKVLAIDAAGRSGLLYGTQSLLQILDTDAARSHVPHGSAVDWPSLGQRGEMIDVGRKYYPIPYLKREIRRMAWMKLNMLHLHLTDWNGFRFGSKAYPTLPSPQHYSMAQLRDLDRYAGRYGVTIIPELDVPGHASWLTRWDPSLALQCPSMAVSHWPGGSMGGWMIDPTSAKARTVVKTLLKEMASVFSGPVIHIGGDEIEYDKSKDACPELVDWAQAHGYQYPGDALVDFINDLDDTVRAAGKTAELWHWWDFNGQQTSIAPHKDIRLTIWLEDPKAKAEQGYKTIGSQDGYLYVSPGYSTTPGDYGYMPADEIYETYPFTTGPDIEGYKVSRWSDKAENNSVAWFDFFARRPVAVLAERTWGGPRSETAARFYQRVAAVGDAPPEHLTAVPQQDYRVVDVSSEETQAEDAGAQKAIDGDPLTAWSSKYSSLAPLGPQHLTIDLGARQRVAGVRIEPRQDGKTVANLYDTEGRIKDYRIQVSSDQRSWRTVSSGTLPDQQPASTLRFPETSARFVRVVALDDWKAVFVDAIADLTVLRSGPQ